MRHLEVLEDVCVNALFHRHATNKGRFGGQVRRRCRSLEQRKPRKGLA